MVELLIIRVTNAYPHNRVTDTIGPVTLNTMNGVQWKREVLLKNVALLRYEGLSNYHFQIQQHFCPLGEPTSKGFVGTKDFLANLRHQRQDASPNTKRLLPTFLKNDFSDYLPNILGSHCPYLLHATIYILV